jgi:uncharacterized protein YdiU (UPF0061 family)
MCAKLGLVDALSIDSQPQARDQTLVADILALLAKQKVDYTIFWRRLSQAQTTGQTELVRDLFLERRDFDVWMLHYSERCTLIDTASQADFMYKSNPKFILRNHLGEMAIQAAKEKDFSVTTKLLNLLESPFEEQPGFESYADFAPDWASQIEISCSS